MKMARRILMRAPLLLMGTLVAFYVVFYFAQQPLIYQSERAVTRTPADLNWEFDRIAIPVDGKTTTGWFIPCDGARGTILFCHGNGGNVGGHLDATRLFREMRFSVLIFDYGGFGESTGSPSERRVYADAMAMWRYLTEQRKLNPNSIVIWGSSFGGAAACDLASKVRPATLVLESTFTSMADAAFADYPYFPADWFLRATFEASIGLERSSRRSSSFTASTTRNIRSRMAARCLPAHTNQRNSSKPAATTMIPYHRDRCISRKSSRFCCDNSRVEVPRIQRSMVPRMSINDERS